MEQDQIKELITVEALNLETAEELTNPKPVRPNTLHLSDLDDT